MGAAWRLSRPRRAVSSAWPGTGRGGRGERGSDGRKALPPFGPGTGWRAGWRATGQRRSPCWARTGCRARRRRHGHDAGRERSPSRPAGWRPRPPAASVSRVLVPGPAFRQEPGDRRGPVSRGDPPHARCLRLVPGAGAYPGAHPCVQRSCCGGAEATDDPRPLEAPGQFVDEARDIGERLRRLPVRVIEHLLLNAGPVRTEATVTASGQATASRAAARQTMSSSGAISCSRSLHTDSPGQGPSHHEPRIACACRTLRQALPRWCGVDRLRARQGV